VVPVRESALFIDSVTVQPMAKGVGYLLSDRLQRLASVLLLPVEHDTAHSPDGLSVYTKS
jgi:hypothetical protein